MNTLTYAGTNLNTFGVWFDSSRKYKKPAKRYLGFDVPARNGTLYASEHKFDNVVIEYRCYIKENFATNYNNLINFLNSFDTYQVLENSVDNTVYRLALFHEELSVDTGQFLKDGQFSLFFDCKPQAFLKSGETEITIENLVNELHLGQINSDGSFSSSTTRVTNATSGTSSQISVSAGTYTLTATGLDYCTVLTKNSSGTVVDNYASAWHEIPYTFVVTANTKLYFTCRKSDNSTITLANVSVNVSVSLTNPTLMASKPIFKLDNETSIILNGETVITYPSVLAVTDKTTTGQGYQIKASNNVFTYSGNVPSGTYDFPCTLLPEGTYNFFGNSNIINCSLVINNGTNRIIYSGHTFTIADDDVSMSVRIHGGTSGAYTIKPVVTLGAVYVDCELMDCYLEDGTNANPYVQLTDGFITIPRGVSVLETDRTQFLVATVKPRWWRL